MHRKHTHSLWMDLTIFAIAFVFFFYSTRKLLHPQVPHAVSAPLPARGPAESPEPNDSRLPASLSTSRAMSFDTILAVGCLPNSSNKQLRTNLDYLRISGDLCESKKIKVLSGIAKNQTNGAEISTFVDHLTKKIATNYFPLQSGENKIMLEFILSNGKKQNTELVIEHY